MRRSQFHTDTESNKTREAALPCCCADRKARIAENGPSASFVNVLHFSGSNILAANPSAGDPRCQGPQGQEPLALCPGFLEKEAVLFKAHPDVRKETVYSFCACFWQMIHFPPDGSPGVQLGQGSLRLWDTGAR